MAIEMQNLISEYVRAVRKIYGHHLKQIKPNIMMYL